MADTLLTPVAQRKQPRKPTTWTVKVYQKAKGASKRVHTTSITALIRDAADVTRATLAAQGFNVRKFNFGTNATLIVEAVPITPVRLAPRRPTVARSPKLRVTYSPTRKTNEGS